MDEAWHHFRIIQDGMTVAGGSSVDRLTMLGEMWHYSAVYSQDGPIKIEMRSGKGRWKEYAP